jgi:hypothetical protein
LLQDDIAKFVSNPTPPPRLVDIPEEGKSKAKERREVGEIDDTVTIEDTSDEEDGETLQERFQLRYRFNRPGLPITPHIEDPPTSLEASLPASPRRPRNVARKCVAKKLKVTETTSQEVSSSSRVVEYLFLKHCMLTVELQEIPSSDPVDLGEEGDWDTVGRATERSCSPAPTIEKIVPESAQQATGASEPPASTEEGRPEPSATTGVMEPVVAHVEEEAPAEARLLDITSILGAPTVTVVRSNL